jgi:Tol biopolymer transport system component
VWTEISADGRFVAFVSDADNLVPGDTNGVVDVFVHDRQTGRTERVSVSSRDVQGDSDSGAGGLSISADGRFVAFASAATNLVPGDTNGEDDIFVRDRKLGRTERISIGPHGRQADFVSRTPSISANGRFVAFESFADDLVPGDTNQVLDIFVRDRRAGRTDLVSLSSRNRLGDDASVSPVISADGRFVAFVSDADNLVPGDTNGRTDVFVRRR